ncbi:MAG TPA: hypothetical protein EYG75_01935 [Campylobacterales bacterium]|nr:hypothetical protein [Campylobacterales bacterium]
MVIESIREFQKDLTKYLNINEPIMINDKKTGKTRGVFLPIDIYNEMAKDYKKSILDDAIRTFDENPATLDGIETINKGLS